MSIAAPYDVGVAAFYAEKQPNILAMMTSLMISFSAREGKRVFLADDIFVLIL